VGEELAMGTKLLSIAVDKGKESCSKQKELEEKYFKYLISKSPEIPDIDVSVSESVPKPVPDGWLVGELSKKEDTVKVEIEVGDVCMVKDATYISSEFDELAIETGHIDIVTEKYVTLKNYNKVNGREVRVLIVKQNKHQPLDMVAIVETIDSLVYLKFVIRTKGLDIGCNNKEYVQKRRDSFLEKYILGKPVSKAIPDECVDTLLIKLITRRNPMDMQFINPNLLTDEDYGRMLRQDGGLLGLIPEDRRSLELCQIAIKNEDYAETFIPSKFKSLVKG